MVSTFTPNIQIEEPARGDDVGTWDTPVNNNSTLLDLTIGGINTIPLNNSNVVLSAAQFQSKTITFNSTLTGSVTITFPTSFVKSYEIFNLCTGSSAFIITLATSTPVSFVCPPPGQIVEVLNSGPGGLFFKNLPAIGSYMDYAGSSVPNWVSGCSKVPYLNCDGTAFSSATFPTLATILGGTTLPDARGRSRFALGQGTGRLTSAGAGIDGTTLLAAGGNNGVALSAAQIPTITSTGTVFPTGNPALGGVFQNNALFNGTLQVAAAGGTGQFVAATNSGGWGQAGFSGSMTYANGAQQVTPATIPGFVGGLTLIRAG